MRLTVTLSKDATQSYDIVIGYDIFDRIAEMIVHERLASRYVIVSDDHVAHLYGTMLQSHFTSLNVKTNLIVFPAGERTKNIHSVLEICVKMLDCGADRMSVLIALGGGVVGDLTGFIASIYMRGIPIVQVPTTLMAQVDSSIGGKTAIDFLQGKNLLGTFYQPSSVFIDIKCLNTLPLEEYKNGLAEVVKYGIVMSEVFFQKLEDGVDCLLDRDRPFLEEVIRTACSIKKDIVEKDEKECGLRRVLNFGHTLGHAIEASSGYTISHGRAVAIGMVGIARLSNVILDLPNEDMTRIERLISAMGMEYRIPYDVNTADILDALRRDKKKEGDTINFVALRKIGSPVVKGDVSDSLLRDIIEGLKK